MVPYFVALYKLTFLKRKVKLSETRHHGKNRFIYLFLAVPSQASSKSKLSQESLGRQKSPLDERQNRQGSPGAPGSAQGGMEDEEEEEGNHDTITSLAGAKMMQGPMYKNFFTFNSVLVEIIFLI
jgi:hypothetical protein